MPPPREECPGSPPPRPGPHGGPRAPRPGRCPSRSTLSRRPPLNPLVVHIPLLVEDRQHRGSLAVQEDGPTVVAALQGRPALSTCHVKRVSRSPVRTLREWLFTKCSLFFPDLFLNGDPPGSGHAMSGTHFELELGRPPVIIMDGHAEAYSGANWTAPTL